MGACASAEPPRDYIQRAIKIVVVGEHGVGKTSLLTRFCSGQWSEDYMPSMFDPPSLRRDVDGKPVMLSLWDTAGETDYDRLRPLSYPQADVVLVCLPTARMQRSGCSLAEHARLVDTRWKEELHTHAPGVPLLLIGTKLDMATMWALDGVECEELEQAQGEALADVIGAVGYLTCSAKTGEGVRDVFDAAARTVMQPQSSWLVQRAVPVALAVPVAEAAPHEAEAVANVALTAVPPAAPACAKDARGDGGGSGGSVGDQLKGGDGRIRRTSSSGSNSSSSSSSGSETD